MKLSDILDEIREKNGLKRNRALAAFIGLDERRVPEYYKGREPMDDDYPKIAMACGRRVDALQAMVKLATETNEKSLEVWRKYYKSIGGIADAFMLMVFVSVTFFVTSAANASENQYLNVINSDRVQIMRLWCQKISLICAAYFRNFCSAFWLRGLTRWRHSKRTSSASTPDSIRRLFSSVIRRYRR